MNHNPNDDDREDLVAKEKIRNLKLRALLDGLDLTPEQTKDDIAKSGNRDSEIIADVPPHHGN